MSCGYFLINYLDLRLFVRPPDVVDMQSMNVFDLSFIPAIMTLHVAQHEASFRSILVK